MYYIFIFSNQQDFLKNGIAGILGNKPNLAVEISQIKTISENQTEIKITVTEKSVTGNSRKIPATELATFLNQTAQKQQLLNVGVSTITPVVTPSKSELEEYLKQPPPGWLFLVKRRLIMIKIILQELTCKCGKQRFKITQIQRSMCQFL